MPCAADRELLTAILRDEWGFDGLRRLRLLRGAADRRRTTGSPATRADAAAMALDAGHRRRAAEHRLLRRAAARRSRRGGSSTRTTLDEAVRRVLRAKFDLGLFERPYVDVERRPPSRRHGRAARARADDRAQEPRAPEERRRPAARAGARLDRGDRPERRRRRATSSATTPTRRTSSRCARCSTAGEHVFSIAGAGRLEFGDHGCSRRPRCVDALRDALRRAGRVRARAATSRSESTRRVRGGRRARRAPSDVAVMVMGDKSGLTDDCTSGESRDRASLDLPGRPGGARARRRRDRDARSCSCSSPAGPGSAWLHEHCAAVLLAWLPGRGRAPGDRRRAHRRREPRRQAPDLVPARGRAGARLLRPQGLGRAVALERRLRRLAGAAPLYPFGHGLSYTTFELSDAAIRDPTVPWTATIDVDVTVTNTGDRSGDEVVQLYIRDPQASITRPVLELKSFVRVALDPGESSGSRSTCPSAQLGFYDREL